MEVRSDWENLAPEILAMVLQRVQAWCGESSEGRRIVAVAGVCKSWRQLVLQQEAVNMVQSMCSSSPLIRFPAEIRRQPPADCPLQCVLKKTGNSFSFFQIVQSSEGVNEEYFLLGAHKRYMPSCSSFELSMDSRILQAKDRSSGNSVLASVRSNFSRSEFIIGDREAAELGTSSQSLCVKYSEEVMPGMRQRKLSCSLQGASRTSTSSSPKTSRARASPARASAATGRSFFAWTCLFNTRRQVRRVQNTLKDEPEQIRRHDDGVLPEKRPMVEDHRGEEAAGSRSESPGSLTLKSKTPEWNEEYGYWSLDFKGRATVASIHNFQLMSSSDSASSDHASPDQKVVLQLGKVAKGIYQVDFCSPLSALEAFSICLTSFATNVGLEP